MATTWGFKNDTGAWTEADPFSDTSPAAADAAAGFPLETYKKAAGVAYEFSKKKLEDTRAQQEALNTQKQKFAESDEPRDYRQAQQPYKY